MMPRDERRAGRRNGDESGDLSRSRDFGLLAGWLIWIRFTAGWTPTMLPDHARIDYLQGENMDRRGHERRTGFYSRPHQDRD